MKQNEIIKGLQIYIKEQRLKRAKRDYEGISSFINIIGFVLWFFYSLSIGLLALIGFMVSIITFVYVTGTPLAIDFGNRMMFLLNYFFGASIVLIIIFIVVNLIRMSIKKRLNKQ